ncbi:hypothetical protein ACFL31_01130 [Candidatus Margulisiibacteriota bacterium]
MNREANKRNYDVASISRKGRAKRENFIQHALLIEKCRLPATGQFVKIFSDMFLKKECGTKSYR